MSLYVVSDFSFFCNAPDNRIHIGGRSECGMPKIIISKNPNTKLACIVTYHRAPYSSVFLFAAEHNQNCPTSILMTNWLPWQNWAFLILLYYVKTPNAQSTEACKINVKPCIACMMPKVANSQFRSLVLIVPTYDWDPQ
jgi:hypothetical protein